MEGAVADAAHDSAAAADDGHRAVAAVKHEARNVLARHVGQLSREDVLQRHQPVLGNATCLKEKAGSNTSARSREPGHTVGQLPRENVLRQSQPVPAGCP